MKTFLQVMLLVAALVAAAEPAHAAMARAGEWETILNGDRRRLVCLHQDRTFDAPTIAKMSQVPGVKCTTGAFRSSGLQAAFNETCEVAGGVMTIDTVVTVTGMDAYTTRSKSHLVGGSIQMPDMDLTQTGHRLGDCKAGDLKSPY